ncbi:nucleoside hydrolase [Acetanaerobacterium sp. MSJ-12]|uniref:nucleoside hydrolase n=1 Tax=Acetanaerobacterium sp. MSJ-12 TaxID=2841535 RepID=UPI001C0E9C3E|nr:nucleoside hydrolase [Acetanaerobacterium sp. MSJ-12]MBU5420640.1 nucleoside hydrolase [Acetanaerobacterium sp. MSJ-12]
MKKVTALLVAVMLLLCGCAKYDKNGRVLTTGGTLYPNGGLVEAAGAAKQSPIPVILDVDGGADDVLAVILAAKCEGLDVRGIAVTQGCVDLQTAGRNVLMACAFANLDVPVALGAEKPMEREAVTDPQHHGADGLAGMQLPPTERALSELTAEELYCQVADECSGRLQIITLGPLTNLGQVLKSHPELIGKIERVVAGCGTLDGLPEFNAQNDPEALQMVMDSGVSLTFLVNNICDRSFVEFTPLRDDLISRQGTSRYILCAENRPKSRLSQLYMEIGKTEKGNRMYGYLVVDWVNNEQAAQPPEQMVVTVSLEEGEKGGQMQFDTALRADEGYPVVLESTTLLWDKLEELAECYNK